MNRSSIQSSKTLKSRFPPLVGLDSISTSSSVYKKHGYIAQDEAYSIAACTRQFSILNAIENSQLDASSQFHRLPEELASRVSQYALSNEV